MASTSERRVSILQAAQECFAEKGYDRTTTASICARAGVSSGTFFHHFPTKAAVLDSWLDRLVAEAGDPHLPVIVTAVDAARNEADVCELLRAGAAQAHDALTAVVSAGQRQGRWRTDRSAERLATWVGVLADGVLGRSVEDAGIDVANMRAEFAEVVRSILV